MVVLHYRNKPQFIYDYITEGHLNWIMFLLLLLPTVLPCTFLLPKVYFQEWICWVLRDIQLYKAMLTVSQSNSLNLVHESCHCLASLPKFGFVKLFLFLPICWVWNRIVSSTWSTHWVRYSGSSSPGWNLQRTALLPSHVGAGHRGLFFEVISNPEQCSPNSTKIFCCIWENVNILPC